MVNKNENHKQLLSTGDGTITKNVCVIAMKIKIKVVERTTGFLNTHITLRKKYSSSRAASILPKLPPASRMAPALPSFDMQRILWEIKRKTSLQFAKNSVVARLPDVVDRTIRIIECQKASIDFCSSRLLAVLHSPDGASGQHTRWFHNTVHDCSSALPRD